jgi:hypothetical protein
MAKFLGLIMHSGEVPADWTDRPAPDPAQFGLPTEDDGSREDPMLGRGHIVKLPVAADRAQTRSAALAVTGR